VPEREGDWDRRYGAPFPPPRWPPSSSCGYCERSTYEQCALCDHFIEPDAEDGLFRHLDDGEQTYDHDPEPSGEAHSFAGWVEQRPDQFVQHSDGRIGPNSALHGNRRGKIDLWDH
jgi:hypothetical protein